MNKEWSLVQDARGVPLGRYQSSRDLVRGEIEWIKKFLISLQKNRREENMSKSQSTEQVNMVFLAGTLKFDPKINETSVRCLIDTGQKNAVQVGAQGALADKLKRFREKDFIKCVAILEPYGIKQADGTWKNGLAVRLTEIKNEPPKHVEQQRQGQLSDDDLPF